VGPGNVFAAFLVDVQGYGASVVRENAFGFDPSTGRVTAPTSVGVQLFATDAAQLASVRDNLFVAASQAIVVPFGSSSPTVEIVGNEIRADAASGENSSGGGIRLSGAHGIVGPGNHIHGLTGVFAAVALADDLGTPSMVALTQNSIHDNAIGIAYSSTPPTLPPELLGWDGEALTGTCAVAGLVEVFLDHANQGETYLGSLACDGSTTWSFDYPRDALLAGSWNFTATLTDGAARTSEFSLPVPAL
jgi:hypothetical protein